MVQKKECKDQNVNKKIKIKFSIDLSVYLKGFFVFIKLKSFDSAQDDIANTTFYYCQAERSGSIGV